MAHSTLVTKHHLYQNVFFCVSNKLPLIRLNYGKQVRLVNLILYFHIWINVNVFVCVRSSVIKLCVGCAGKVCAENGARRFKHAVFGRKQWGYLIGALFTSVEAVCARWCVPLTRWRRVPCDHSTTMSSDGRRQEAPEDPLFNRTLTWHEHVYRKLSGRPTPHYIENILGLQEEKIPQPQEPVPTICSAVPDMNEPLNLSIKSDLKVRSKTVKGGCCDIETSVLKFLG